MRQLNMHYAAREAVRRSLYFGDGDALSLTLDSKLRRELGTSLTGAARIVLDKSASDALIRLSRSYDILADLIPRARLPVSRAFIELDLATLHGVAGEPDNRGELMGVAFLMERVSLINAKHHKPAPVSSAAVFTTTFVYMAPDDEGDPIVGWSPFSFLLDPMDQHGALISVTSDLIGEHFVRVLKTAAKKHGADEFDITPLAASRGFMIGGGEHLRQRLATKDVNVESLNGIAAKIAVTPSIYTPAELMAPTLKAFSKTPDRESLSMVKTLMHDMAGLPRAAFSVLTLLSMPEASLGTIKPASERARLPGVPRLDAKAFLAHKVVTFDLRGSALDDKEVGAPTGIKHRRHEVRGHYCLSRKKGSPSCRTLCHPQRIDDRTEACSSCGKKRWWRELHMRGSAEVGFVTHDYAVTAGSA